MLVDRQQFPRWKVCGACLNPGTLGLLERVGLGTLVDSLGGVPLRRFRVAGWSRQASLSLPGSLAISRQALDAALIGAAIRSGVQFLPGVCASLLGCHGKRRRVRLELLGRRTAKVGAPGAAGVV